ncbi:MAG: hypothetical protein ACXACX_17435 [Candidatus Hodarchaeales archaeon]|jgi:hypothetical protein
MKKSLLLSAIVAIIGIAFIGSYLTGYLVAGNETENVTQNITPEVIPEIKPEEAPSTRIILNPGFEETKENDFPINWYQVDYYDKENRDTIEWDKRFWELTDESYSGNKALVFHNVGINEFAKPVKTTNIVDFPNPLEFSFYFKENFTYDKTDDMDDYAFCFEIITSNNVEEFDDITLCFNRTSIECISDNQANCGSSQIIDLGNWKQGRVRISNFNPSGNVLHLYAFDNTFVNQGYIIIDSLEFSTSK